MSYRRPVRRVALAAALTATVLASPLRGGDATATPEPWTYFEVTDGTKIAAAVRTPDHCTDDTPCPVLLMMDGYGAGGTGGINPAGYNDNYITVYASVRGTGCSGGVFNLFDYRHAEDGHDIIVNHLPKLPGSNGDVGIIGHSYPGLTGWMVASTSPPNVKAIALSGLIDDLYRGIVFPGGVPNYGFPLVWTGAYRPASETAGNAGRYAGETASGDPTCVANIATRNTDVPGAVESVLENAIVNGGVNVDDSNWWRDHSTLTRIGGIKAPIHITQQYQDEQTGPRGGHVLFQRLGEQVPKRLVVTNGVHATTGVGHTDRVRWLDCWILHDGDIGASAADGTPCRDVLDPDKRVHLFFESTSSSSRPLAEAFEASDWPLSASDAAWTRFFLHEDGTLSTTDTLGEGTRSYVHTTAGRQVTADAGFQLGNDGLGRATFFDGPDQLRYEYEVTGADPMVVAGPINLTLTASSTAPNTDFFVDVLDVAPDGRISYLQRGMQRASHRAIDYADDRTDYTPDGDIYRAWHPHSNTTTKLLTPTMPEQFEIEVFPLGWIFRPGHKLVLQLHAPPPADPLSIYAWVSGLPTAVNTVHHDSVAGLAPSSILIPLIKDPSRVPGATAAGPGCVAVQGVPCFSPATPDITAG